MSLCILLASGCATSRKTGWEDGGDAIQMTEAERKSEFEAGLALWKNRHQKDQLEKALEKFERVARADTKNIDYLVYLSRGYYLLADSHYEDVEQKIKTWEIGAQWGERAMATNANFHKIVVEDKKDMEDGLDALTHREAPAIYWTAVNLGKWGKASGIATILKYKGLVKKMIERVERLNPTYYYGAVHRYWGVYYAVAPFFAGGSMEESEKHFKKTFAMANDYLASHVLYAENYLTKKSDKEGFKKELDGVLKADPKKLADVYPEQVLEQQKAKKMLDKIEDLF